MPTYLHPGVYVEEIPSGAKPIEAVGTSITAFVGAVKKGPAGEPKLIHSWDDYENTFGPIASSKDYMGLAVSAFYLNGGKDAYVARLVSTSSPAAAAFTPTVDGEGDGVGGVLVITATSVGTWGNEVYIRIVKPKETDLKFTLEVGHLEQDEFVADETFSNVNMNAKSDNYILTQVNGISKLVTVSLAKNVENHYQNGSLTGAVMGAWDTVFFDGIKHNMTLSINVDGLGVERITLGTRESFGFDVKGNNTADGEKVAKAIKLKVQALGPQKSYEDFTCSYTGDRKFQLTSGTSSSSSSVVVYDGDGSKSDLAKFLKLNAAANPVSVHGSAKVVPKALAGVTRQGEHLKEGKEGSPTIAEYKTFFSTKLKKIHDVSVIVLPGEHMPETGGNTIIDEALAHAEETKSRMVIIDPPPGVELDQSTKVDQIGLSTSTYSVLYYPWVKVVNPLYNADTNPNVDKTLTIAPSAFAAGMWSKIDGRRGVWKAPAGLETSLLGVAGLEFTVGDGDQNLLNPIGVNCLRKMPGAGPVIWGSRTLSTKTNPEWRYVPVRRTAIFIEQSIYKGIQWAVFEPNDHRLWSSLRLNIDSFMNGLFRSGAFQGEKVSDAYFVRCGLDDTMTQGDINRGQVIVIVGFAPLKPAEFVIVRIQQKVEQQ
ncbi:MAG: phage tail sheath subtilisin-like domain-containing protein [Deltaproteobacteria bacterium]|nr:phage tail sheath subtilisin-like domain-containing protein [Deltaproteobacteria bacterium]